MSDKQRTYGQYETPADVADLLLAFCLRQPADRLLDPSCGTGIFLARAALLQHWLAPGQSLPETLWGVELDPQAARQARERLPQAQIVEGNFFELEPWPDRPFDAIVGNPPYTRAEWIGRLPETVELVRQLSFFNGLGEGQLDQAVSHPARHPVLDRRAGLHAYFFLHGTDFLREGGRFGFVVPNSWLDVAYGERLKQFLLDHYRILAIIESNVERWFDEAKVNTCLVILEKCSDADARTANRVRLVRLRKPLAELIHYPQDDAQRMSHMERLITRMLPGKETQSDELAIRLVSQGDLSAGEKWGVALRAPAVYRRQFVNANLVPLGSWATVRRGYTTGANAFFYLDAKKIASCEIEPRFRRPLLKSLRHVNRRTISPANCEHQVLLIPPLSDLRGTKAAEYIDWGQSQGWHQRSTCANRQPWYSLPEQGHAELLLPKGIWERHFAPVVENEILVDQQLYRVHLADGIPTLAAAALLNSAWFALQMELLGRVNFGEGVLWLATYELEGLRLPDPRYLPEAKVDRLIEAYQSVLGRPVTTVAHDVTEPAWHAYNGIVFEILGLSPSEAGTVIEGLLERVATRRMKARTIN